MREILIGPFSPSVNTFSSVFYGMYTRLGIRMSQPGSSVKKKQKEPDLYPRFYECFIADLACLFLVSRCACGFVIFQLT